MALSRLAQPKKQTSIPFPLLLSEKPEPQLRCKAFDRRAGLLAWLSQPTRKQKLVVVVYLKNAHGSDAAEIARPIFEEFAGKPASKNNSPHVTVNKVSENTTQQVSLEDYVLQVVVD